jgi:hypothetical protein
VRETPDVDATVRRIEDLLEELGGADTQLRGQTEEVIRLLMHLYGTGLSRALEILGHETAGRLAEDKLLGSILLLHGLHPVDAETRIAEALHRVERRLDGHRVSLSGIVDEVARIRVERNGAPLPSGLAAAIEHAVAESAPDVMGIEIEGLPEPAPALVQIAK